MMVKLTARFLDKVEVKHSIFLETQMIPVKYKSKQYLNFDNFLRDHPYSKSLETNL